MATIVKTQEMLEAFGEQEIAVIKSSAVAFFDSVESAEKAVESYQRLLGLTPSWFAYEMARLTWREGIIEAVEQSGKSITDNALNVRWNVFSKKLGIDKPAKTDSADAVRKAEKRAEEKAKQAEQFAGMSVEDFSPPPLIVSAKFTRRSVASERRLSRRARFSGPALIWWR